MTRKIVYISGTRADFGLMAGTLGLLHAEPDLDLSILITGMHLDPHYGDTWREIEQAGLNIMCKVPVALSPPTGATMARALGQLVPACVDAFEANRPDVVLLLGDRGEMLAGAIAAIHLNIPVAHIHGGERSGTVDESLRHAISKLSHIHFTATEDARERLIRLGERAVDVFVTGAPGLDGLREQAVPSREDVMINHGLDPNRPAALVLFHPVLQEAVTAKDQTRAIFHALDAAGWQSVALMPNADAGSDSIRFLYETEAPSGMVQCLHLSRQTFIHTMAALDAVVGNSSAGIIEAASFGTPVINVGTRQNLRERNANVMDVDADFAAIAQALEQVAVSPRPAAINVYGTGQAGVLIAHHLKTHSLCPALLEKVLTY
jgi:GDP/UDP-N,N'-diacetylbacillosamine 2-epimerase (hydrolysing)